MKNRLYLDSEKYESNPLEGRYSCLGGCMKTYDSYEELEHHITSNHCVRCMSRIGDCEHTKGQVPLH